LRKVVLLFFLLLLTGSRVAIGYGLWLRSVGGVEQGIPSDSLAHLPDYVQNAATEVQVAYQYAIDNPEILKQIPCYCGCDKTLGHKHNLACYISAFNPDGSVAQFSDHAAY
jgi:Ni,Fe-hydrogenase III large subunit